jgi:CHAD domain-containing protein
VDEVEWQLDAQDLRPVARWLEQTAANGTHGVSVGRGKTREQIDTYVDTPDRRLDRAGFSLRVRRMAEVPPEATLKSLDATRSDALSVRREISQQLDLDDPSAVSRAGGPVGDRVRALVGPRKLIRLFELHTRRRAFPLTTGETNRGEVLLDETAIHGPDTRRVLSRLHRVEVEVPEQALESVGPLVESMQKMCGLQPAVLSKYESALAATGSQRSEPESFGPTAIGPDATIGEVALAVLRRQFAALLTNEAGTRLGDDIEDLHDMRVASRRLRAAVALFADVLPVEAARLRPELKWLGQTIGAVRDLDVQLAQLDDWASMSPEADRTLARLHALLHEQRTAARAEMLQALDSPRYASFVRRFGTMLRSRSGTRTAPALTTAPALLLRRHRKLRKWMKRIARDDDAAAYHRLRIAGKRFRYALEFLSDVYPGETQPVVKRTVALQDLLGSYQDAQVAKGRLRQLARERSEELGPEAIFAMGEIAERYRAEMEQVRPQVPATAKKISGKAWKRLRKRLATA